MKKDKEEKNIWKELIPYIVILVGVILIRSFLVTPVRVSGMSMYDTLNGGEIMLLFKQGNIERYKMVVADMIVDGKKDDTIIKRVYGLPGERIKCEKGIIYINDKKIEDNYGYGVTNDFKEVTLKEDEYFLLGDNREISLDSRYIGPVKRHDIEGTTSLVIWPFKKIGNIK